MKISKIINGSARTNEEALNAKIKSFNWSYEFSEDIGKIAAGHSDLALLESQVYKLWKSNPEKAIRIWNENCPYASADKTAVPPFILKRKFMEQKQNK